MQQIREKVHRYYETIDEGDLEGVLAMFHPDVMYERGGRPAIDGIAALRQFYEAGRIIREGRHELLSVLVEGQEAAVRGEFTGTLHSGEDVHVRFSDFHVFKDGLIWRRYSYFMDRFV